MKLWLKLLLNLLGGILFYILVGDGGSAVLLIVLLSYFAIKERMSYDKKY
jgi:hypothetical protein